jgi:cytochrome c
MKENQMQKLFSRILLGLVILSFNVGAFAADQATADEATAMVKKAVAYLKTNGKEKAIAEFNNAKGQFIDRDLYIVVLDMKGLCLAHGAQQRLVGKDLTELKDADNKKFTLNWIEVANSKGKGWVDYKWINPVSKAIEQKSSYVEKADDMVIGAGIYKK